MKNIMKVGDKVIWRDSWGKGFPQETEIKTITLVETSTLDGVDVPAVFWDDVPGRDVVVSLTNKKWAYGFQISPLPSPTETDSKKELVMEEAL